MIEISDGLMSTGHTGNVDVGPGLLPVEAGVV